MVHSRIAIIAVLAFSAAVAEPPWRVLLSDMGVTVSLDTSAIARQPGGVYLLRFRAQHDKPRDVRGRPYNRGIRELLVRCESLDFKSVSENLSLDDAQPVFHMETPVASLADSAWQAPPPQSIDARFLTAACAHL